MPSAEKNHIGYQIFILALSIWAIGALALSVALPEGHSGHTVLEYADWLVCGLFLIAFVVTLVTSKNRWQYLITWGWLDLLSSIPMLPAARLGRLARIFRVVRVIRSIRATRLVASLVLQQRAENTFLAAALVGVLLTITCSSATLHFEGKAEGAAASDSGVTLGTGQRRRLVEPGVVPHDRLRYCSAPALPRAFLRISSRIVFTLSSKACFSACDLAASCAATRLARSTTQVFTPKKEPKTKSATHKAGLLPMTADRRATQTKNAVAQTTIMADDFHIHSHMLTPSLFAADNINAPNNVMPNRKNIAHPKACRWSLLSFCPTKTSLLPSPSVSKPRPMNMAHAPFGWQHPIAVARPMSPSPAA